METLTYRFWYPQGIMGDTICWWTSSDESHVSYIARGNEYEALPGGVQRHKPKEFWATTGVEISFQVPTELVDKVVKWSDKQVGKRYDWLGDLQFAIPFLRQLRQSWYCSHLGYDAGVIAKIFPDKNMIFSPHSVRLLAEQRQFDGI